VLFASPADRLDAWEGAPIDLERKLLESNLAGEARALFMFTNACATFLGRLSRSHPDRVSSRRINGRTRWLISSDLSPDVTKAHARAARRQIIRLLKRFPESRAIIRRLDTRQKRKPLMGESESNPQ